MSVPARLVLRHDPAKVAPLDPVRPLTIGRGEGNRLRLPSAAGVAANHAVVRFSPSHGWIVCDWQSGEAGTWLEGERVIQCRPLGDGDEIRLGDQGPVLVFQLLADAVAAGSPPSPPPPPAAAAPEPAGRAGVAAAQESVGSSAASAPPGQQVPEPAGTPRPSPAAAVVPPAPVQRQPAASARGALGVSSPGAAGPATLSLGGRTIPLDRILSAEVRSRPRHPHSFSWWLLVCLGGLVLLPWPWLFWPLEALALAGWIVLGARREHVLLVTLRDGMAHRHGFANRITALSHRNGIRRAIGQSPEGVGHLGPGPAGSGSQGR